MDRGKVFESEHKPETCPNCGSTRIADILYGLIAMVSPDMERDIEEGKLILGGCCVRDEVWTCSDCGASFRQRSGPA